MAFTQAEVLEMRNKTRQLEANEDAQLQADIEIKREVAQSWWDIIKPEVPTTRDEALAVYRFIEAEIVIQKNNFDKETVPIQKQIFEFRVELLNIKLREANEKYKERKRNG